jgi:hypothetical protein
MAGILRTRFFVTPKERMTKFRPEADPEDEAAVATREASGEMRTINLLTASEDELGALGLGKSDSTSKAFAKGFALGQRHPLHIPEAVHALSPDQGRLEVAGVMPSRTRRTRAPQERIMLIPHEEEASPSAYLIERRIRALRQVYAALVIADRINHHQMNEEGIELSNDSDLEFLLPDMDRLQILKAGKGSFWVTAGVIAKRAAKYVHDAPDAALRAVSLLFADGRTLLMRRVEADTVIKEESARQAEVATKLADGMADANLRKSHAEASQAETAAKFAEETAELSKDSIRLAQQKERLTAYLEAAKTIDALQDGAMKDQLRAAFEENTRALLGPNSRALPPPPPPAQPDHSVNP